MRSRKTSGFTMAELLIVVAIIAVLVAVAIPTFSNQLEKSRQGTDISTLRQAYAAARIAEMDQRADSAGITGNWGGGKFAIYWYNPDTGDLKVADNTNGLTAEAAVTKGVTAYGKAQGKKLLADLSGLVDGIFTYGDVLDKDNGGDGKYGTQTKGVVVTYKLDGKLWVLKNIGYYLEAGDGGLEVHGGLEEAERDAIVPGFSLGGV